MKNIRISTRTILALLFAFGLYGGSYGASDSLAMNNEDPESPIEITRRLAEGTEVGNPGDLIANRLGNQELIEKWKRYLAEYVAGRTEGLRKDLTDRFLSYSENYNPFLISDPTIAALFSQMFDLQKEAVLDEIASVPLRPGPCLHDGKEKDMGTDSELRSPICIDLDRLAARFALPEELVTLFFEEIAHHFGYVDDEALRSSRAQYFSLGALEPRAFEAFLERKNTDPGSEDGALRFHLLMTAVEQGATAPREISTDWILAEDSAANPTTAEQLRSLIELYEAENREFNPNFNLEIIEERSVTANLVTEFEGSAVVDLREFELRTSDGKTTRTPYFYKREGRSRLLRIDRSNAEAYLKTSSVVLVKYVVTVRQPLENLTDEDLESANVEKSLEYVQSASELNTRVNRWAAIALPESNGGTEVRAEQNNLISTFSAIFKIKVNRTSREPTGWNSDGSYSVSIRVGKPEKEITINGVINAYIARFHTYLFEYKALVEQVQTLGELGFVSEEVVRRIERPFRTSRDRIWREKRVISVHGDRYPGLHILTDETREGLLLLNEPK